MQRQCIHSALGGDAGRIRKMLSTDNSIVRIGSVLGSYDPSELCEEGRRSGLRRRRDLKLRTSLRDLLRVTVLMANICKSSSSALKIFIDKETRRVEAMDTTDKMAARTSKHSEGSSKFRDGQSACTQVGRHMQPTI